MAPNPNVLVLAPNAGACVVVVLNRVEPAVLVPKAGGLFAPKRPVVVVFVLPPNENVLFCPNAPDVPRPDPVPNMPGALVVAGWPKPVLPNKGLFSVVCWKPPNIPVVAVEPFRPAM